MPVPDVDFDAIRLLEQLSFNAWPALRVVVQDDWILRFADGYTKRANSVNALAPARDTPAADLRRRVADAEALYDRQRIACVFRVTPLMDPGLGALLQTRGWIAHDDTVVMTTALDAGSAAPPEVVVAAARDDAWSHGYMAFNGVPPQRQAIHDRMLAAIVPPSGFASARDERGSPVAFGLGVVERGHVGLFDIVSDPARRRGGHGRRLVEGILAWGRAQGAVRAYLQVAAANAPAISLYEKLGFREAYRYRYWSAPG
jgi:ribosomal protein S18 acetylase RimI-like enzyme